MKEIKLFNFDKFFIIDDEDYDRIIKFNWHGGLDRDKILINRIHRRFENGSISLASEIMLQRTKLFDHKDRNIFNNQKLNLRIATRTENAINRTKTFSITSSKYKGVSWNKSVRKWNTYITLNGKRSYLGFYSSEIQAALVYNEKAKELFGEFACINTI